jgi:hypothetical protein
MSKYAPSIPPFHLLVSEPELKWCEAIIHGETFVHYPVFDGTFPTTRQMHKILLMLNTNMSEVRVDRALNLLYYSKRI